MLRGAEQWTANTSLVLLPNKTVSPDTAAGYFDTLNSGQIESTASQVLGLGRFKNAAASDLNLSPAQSAATAVHSSAVTGSSIVTVSVTGPSRQIAEQMADGVVAQATRTVNTLIAPFQLSVVSQAVGTGTRTNGLGSNKFAVILVVVALAIAFGVQQAVSQLIRVRSTTYRRTDELEPGTDEDASAARENGSGAARPKPEQQPVAEETKPENGSAAETPKPAAAATSPPSSAR